MKKVVIVGGGFGGIRCALDLAKKKPKDVKVVLVSDRPNFEFHAAQYKIVTGHSPLEVCIPLREIFARQDVEVVEDAVTSVDVAGGVLLGASGSRYAFDFLVLALGSEPAYFGIPGLAEFSFGMYSIDRALQLKRHLHEVFEQVKRAAPEEKVPAAHIVIIGAGPTGVELAGELASYARNLARRHGFSSSFITIDLVEALSRVLPVLPEHMSDRVMARLQCLGVNLLLNRAIVKEEVEQVFLKDMQMKTKTVVWTAGMKANALYAQVPGFTTDKKGRVEVDDFLQAKGCADIFVIGDGAATVYSGMAQTAIDNGHFAAAAILRRLSGKAPQSSVSKKPVFAIPVGPGWAVVALGPITLTGLLGWWLRRVADLRYFFSILPFRKALSVWKSGEELTESCEECSCNV